MTLPDLIARLDALQVAVYLHDGKPKLRFPPGSNTAKIMAELGDDLTTHRAEVLAHYTPQESPEHPGRLCGKCGATMYHESAEDQFRACGNIMCPAWRDGLASAPEWVGTAREGMAYQARRQAEKAAQQSQPVPE